VFLEAERPSAAGGSRSQSSANLPCTQPGYPQGFRDLPVKSKIIAEPCCIGNADATCPDIESHAGPEFNRFALTQPPAGIQPVSIPGKMIADVIKKPV
jgi:hypothetical protein